MNVLLKKSLPPHGKAGDVISVSDSYARNVLLPQGIAVVATAAVVASAEKQKRQAHQERQQVEHQQQALLERLGTITVQMQGRANANGTLYAAIQEPDVVRAIQQQQSVPIRGLHLSGLPIKTTGDHEVGIRLASGGAGSIRVTVSPLT